MQWIMFTLPKIEMAPTVWTLTWSNATEFCSIEFFSQMNYPATIPWKLLTMQLMVIYFLPLPFETTAIFFLTLMNLVSIYCVFYKTTISFFKSRRKILCALLGLWTYDVYILHIRASTKIQFFCPPPHWGITPLANYYYQRMLLCQQILLCQCFPPVVRQKCTYVNMARSECLV